MCQQRSASLGNTNPAPLPTCRTAPASCAISVFLLPAISLPNLPTSWPGILVSCLQTRVWITWGKSAGVVAVFLIYTSVNYGLCFKKMLDGVPVTLQRREWETFFVDGLLKIDLPSAIMHATTSLTQGLCSTQRTTEATSNLQPVRCNRLSPGTV